MKKIFKSLIVLTAISGTVFTSCTKDPVTPPTTDSAKPTITLNSGVATDTKSANVDTIKLNILASAASDRKIKKLTITRAVTGAATVTIDSPSYNAKDVIYTYNDLIKSNPNIVLDDGSSITYTVTVVDDNGKSAVANYVVNIKTVGKSNDIYLGGPGSSNDYKFFGITENFQRYRVGTTGAYLAKDNSAKIDFIFFYSSEGAVLNALYSPDYAFLSGQGYYNETLSWTTRNHTIYTSTTMTASQFDALQGQSFLTELMLVDFTVARDRIRNLTIDQIIAYKKSDGKRGFIKVARPAADASSQALFITKAEL